MQAGKLARTIDFELEASSQFQSGRTVLHYHYHNHVEQLQSQSNYIGAITNNQDGSTSIQGNLGTMMARKFSRSLRRCVRMRTSKGMDAES